MNINVQDYQGWTPLHCAAYLGDSNTVRYLLRNGASMDIRDSNGKIPIEIAIEHGHF